MSVSRQVAPAELEALLVTHPAVADAAVIGKPDERDGERPVGFVALKPNMKASPEELQDFVAGWCLGTACFNNLFGLYIACVEQTEHRPNGGEECVRLSSLVLYS